MMINRFIDTTNEVEQLNTTLEHKVAERTHELNAANARLKELSLCDPLTGLRNRRYISEYVLDHVNSFFQTKLFLSRNIPDKRNYHIENKVIGILMVDIDFFKTVNDRYGHTAGDKVLLVFSQKLKDLIRTDDILIRWGGEEFLIILNKTDPDYMPIVAKKILNLFRQNPIRIDEGIHISITCSVGGTTFPIDPRMVELLSFNNCIDCADKALYHAKNSGRNRATLVEINENALENRTPENSRACGDDTLICLDDPVFIKTTVV